MVAPAGAGAAEPQLLQPPQVLQVSQQSQLLWKWPFSLLSRPSLQQVSQVLQELQVLQVGAQVSQQLLWKWLFSLLKQLSLQQVSQVLQVLQVGAQVLQQSQLLWKWPFSLLKQLSLQHESQPVSHVLPQLPPQHEEPAATATGAATGAALAGAAASAPANQAVVINRNAAFTSYPP